jgi:hypothetical protein
MSKEIDIIAKVTDKTVKGADGKFKVTEIKGKCVQYASVSEAVKAMTEEKALAVINMHVKIRALDALRGGSSPSLSKMFKTASPEAQAKIKALLGLK